MFEKAQVTHHFSEACKAMTGAESESPGIARKRDGAAPLVRPNTRVSAASNNNVDISRTHHQKGILRSSLVTKVPRSSEAGDMEANRASEKKDSTSGARLASRVVEQHCAPLRRRRAAEGHKRDGDSDLRLRLEEKEKLVEQLKSEVEILKVCSEKLRVLNAELESENNQLRSDMATAQEQISMLSSRHHHHNQTVNQPVEKKAGKLVPSYSPPPPPPPPPPLPRQPRAQAALSPNYLRLPNKEDATLITFSAVPKTPSSVLEFHHSIKQLNIQQIDLRKEKTTEPAAASPTSCNISLKPANLHNSIVGEIQSRSSYLLAIKADVQNKGEFINHVIQTIKNTVFEDIGQLLTFVEWLDKELSSLSDERAVLRHFDWPEKKADAMREAAFEYRDLKHLVKEISSYEDDPTSPSELALKKMSYLLDKSEKCIDNLNKLRESCLQYYGDNRIPTEWMLQSGGISKIKQANIKLAKLYLKRVFHELESSRKMDKECSTQEGLLRQCVHYAYRAHQFAGGLDKDIMSALEEIRVRIPNHKK